MNSRADALMASGIGSRPSMGYPGDKYEMGQEAIEEIEVIAAELCAEVFMRHMQKFVYLLERLLIFMDSRRLANQEIQSQCRPPLKAGM